MSNKPALTPPLRLLHLGLVGLVGLASACTGGEQETETSATTTTMGSTTQTSITTTTTTTSDTGPVLVCVPGEVKCSPGLDAVQTCKPDGQGFASEPCGVYQACFVDECLGPCELIQDPPSSEGCSFHTHRMLHYQEAASDAIIVGNISNAMPATVQLFFQPNGKRKEEPLGEPVVIEQGQTHLFALENSFMAGYSGYRTGGTYHVVADLPVIAYQHSPLTNTATNDSSLLLPDHTLGLNYVVASYSPFGVNASYFNVIAIEDDTMVEWTPRVDTAGNNLPVPFVNAGETGKIKMNRGDTLQIGASAVNMENEEDNYLRDVSGTVVSSNKPIWLAGAARCSYVPYTSGWCDHLQEVMFPLETWGKIYVGAHPPLRSAEKHYWRIYAGEAGVTVTTDPPQPGTPLVLGARGEWAELVFDHGVSVIFSGDKPFLPVQYLAGNQADAGYGDPAMYQMVPVEQFLSRYAFATGVNYGLNYVQVIREKGGAEVQVDGVTVTGYTEVGAYEVADWRIEEGAHEAISEKPFGIISIGYTIPRNCLPEWMDKKCGTNDTGGACMTDAECAGVQFCSKQDGQTEGICRHKLCCAPCDSKNIDCNKKGFPLCSCPGPNASYAYPGGMRTTKIYSP
ncbi:MAG: IgGFc-binding protein [Nannocystis sp.]|jgi:hypothetical protein|nr:IgGFc-binding protein [Nannocystis sp.]